MTSRKMMTLRLGLALLMTGTALGAAAQAQGFNASPYGDTAGDTLTRNLRIIADQPRNLSALIGAGRAALELGDPQAALTFFARAEEIAPRDGRVKAGMGAVFVQTEQAAAALQFFRDAAALGTPEAEFAADRGLAYDLSGDPRRAQADYLTALRRQENPEVRRRLALSLAISGERDKAIATIDSQLRAQDRAAWRVRSFILALTGDAAEATRSAEAVMPAQAAQLRPFFAALPRLKPADRAMAVHFGHFPSDPGAIQMASAPTQYASVAPAVTPAPAAPESGRVSRRSRTPEATSTASRRRPGTDESAARQQRQSASSLMAERYGWTGRGITPRRNDTSKTKPTALADAGDASRAASPPAAQAPARTQQELVPQAQQPGAPTTQQSLALAQARVNAPPVQTPAPTQQASTPQVRTPAPPVQGPPQTQPVATAQVQATNPTVQAPPQGSALAQNQVTAPIQGPPQVQPGLSSTINSAVPSALAGPTQTQPQATPSIQVAEVAPSSTPGPLGTAPAGRAGEITGPPAIERPAPGASTLASIAAAIESLPPETDAKPKPKAPVPTKLAANTVTKPTYGPKFETAQAKATPAKAEPTKKEAAAKAATSKEGAKAPASKKEEEEKTASAKKEAASKSPKKEEPKAKEPSRHWVQIAGGANEAAMEREFLRLKAKAPKLLAARAAWTTPLRATNRLLVGPFKSAEEAQEFVNELAKLDLPAFSWTSPAGQEIVKLASK